MSRFLFVAGAVLAATAVALGAFAAHGLQAHVDEEKVRIFEVGVMYHLFHALARSFSRYFLKSREQVPQSGGVSRFF